jgi:hypothetical protein
MKNAIWNSSDYKNQCIFAHPNVCITCLVQKLNLYFPTHLWVLQVQSNAYLKNPYVSILPIVVQI